MSDPFRSYLADLVGRIDGVVGVSLLGLDGIVVDSIRKSEIPLDSIGAELGSFVKSMRMSTAELDIGDIEQFTLATDQYVTFLSAVTREYFILLVMQKNGNAGRARYELAKLKYKLRDELI